MSEEELRAEFETEITAKDLMDFKVYHNYHSVSGIAGLLFGIIALVICVISINQVNISYTLMMGFFLFFHIEFHQKENRTKEEKLRNVRKLA